MPRDRRSKDKDADAFIDAGGSAPGEGGEEQEITTFSTRFPAKLVDRIDEAIENQMVSESRNRWLMRAAVEKLEREE
jgi:hypothetical protein